jgi:glycosyltransferase involved in cell wall biosynthesis
LSAEPKQLRVLHVITGLDTGGAETMLLKLMTASRDSYAAQKAISMTDLGPVGTKMRAQGLDAECLEIPRGAISPKGVSRFVGALRVFQPTIVVSWMYHANIFALLSRAHRTSLPIVWNIRHSLHDLKRDNLLTRAVVRAGAVVSRLPTRIVYNSGRSLQQHAAIGYHRVTASVIPNGFDSDRFKPDETTRSRLRDELRVAPTTPSIGLVARFHPTKNHAMFLDVAVRVAQVFPDLVVIMAGTDVAETNRPFMEAIRARGLEGRVRLLGELSDTAGVLNAVDVACLTSHGESFPNVLGEALLCARPCVATDVGDASVIVADSGTVVPVGSPDPFAEAVCRLLRMPKSERENMGRRARERIIRDYSLEAVSRRYEALYMSVLQ